MTSPDILALEQALAARDAEIARLTKDADREEVAHGNTIDQREAAEEAMSQAYFLITGNSPPWSNVFGFGEALEEIEDAQSTIRQVLSARTAELTELRRAAGEWVAATEQFLAPKVTNARERLRKAIGGDA